MKKLKILKKYQMYSTIPLRVPHHLQNCKIAFNFTASLKLQELLIR